jgi:hypothetical protein
MTAANSQRGTRSAQKRIFDVALAVSPERLVVTHLPCNGIEQSGSEHSPLQASTLSSFGVTYGSKLLSFPGRFSDEIELQLRLLEVSAAGRYNVTVLIYYTSMG